MDIGIKEEVKRVYSELATDPSRAPFVCGRRLALELGYEAAHLHLLPDAVVGGFCGVANVSGSASLLPGIKVLDLACGSGLDSHLAFVRGAEVVGTDFSAAMLSVARQKSGPRFVEADASDLPFENESFDVVLMNGLLNLSQERAKILLETHRVLRPTGWIQAAELIVIEPTTSGTADWFT